MKNFSRIANLLGTWTSTTHLKANIGSYELMAYFVIHLMPDPMSNYRCSINQCDELENKVCVMGEYNVTTTGNTCENMDEHVTDWSDGTIVLCPKFIVNLK